MTHSEVAGEISCPAPVIFLYLSPLSSLSFFLYTHNPMSSFGKVFRVTTYGESHCKGVGAIVDGVPPGLQLTEADIQPQLSRRRPGQSNITTPVSIDHTTQQSPLTLLLTHFLL